MDLKMARLCLDCEEIFQGKLRCPRCGGNSWHPIMRWIETMGEVDGTFVRRKNVLVLAKRPQSDRLIGAAA
jgi:hypothetical protein